MSHITHSGYGYSKRLCENVSSWFLNQFLFRYKIHLEIVHRGMKRENAFGYCDFLDESYRPREFRIELDTYMKQELYIKTLLHELIHLKQWVNGSLQLRHGKVYYLKDPIENYDYFHQPHEIEAKEKEEILYQEYIYQNSNQPFLK